MEKDLSGKVFGRLVALFSLKEIKRKKWFCFCRCGSSLKVRQGSLLDGTTRSCGCLQRDTARALMTKHGKCFSSEWVSWKAMKQRTTCKSNVAFHNYGGRGIYVCARWVKSFENFIKDMGRKPSKGHTLERINNDKGYGPRNCKWATRLEQAQNRRRPANLVSRK